MPTGYAILSRNGLPGCVGKKMQRLARVIGRLLRLKKVSESNGRFNPARGPGIIESTGRRISIGLLTLLPHAKSYPAWRVAYQALQ
jgi:hypothetical protein